MAELLLNHESEVVIFFGSRGKGKSSLMAHFLDDYLKTQGAKRLELSEQLVREENAERKSPLPLPTAPPVYANTKYKLKDITGKDFEPIVIKLEFFMECRHYRVVMLLAAPRAVLINKDIRASGSRFIEPRQVINQFDNFKRLYKTTWYCREFSETGAIEEYISTNGKSDGYVETMYVHNGNVRELYDGYAFKRHFFPPEGKSFEK